MLPVPGPGFRANLWAGFGRKPNANDPRNGPKLPGLKAREFGTGCWSVLIRLAAKSGTKPARKPGQGTLSNLK